MKLPIVRVDPAVAQSLAGGHPWIYRDQLREEPNRESGTWVEVKAGSFGAIGLWDDEGAIAVRLFSRAVVPDVRWLHTRLREAWETRDPVRQPGTTAFRWLFGESDGVPGVTVDLYGPYAVVRTYAGSVEALIDPLVTALRRIVPLQGVLWRPHHGGEGGPDEERTADDGGKVQRVWGDLPPEDLVVEEHGFQFRANLMKGQKTGLFLDHRENRAFLGQLCKGRTMLNCFAYTGAFGVYALGGGARSVVNCDVAQAAAGDAEANLVLNGFDPHANPFVVEDGWELLQRYGEQRRTFDVVVLDPPSFAHSRKQQHAALRAYGRLNTLGIACVSPGGLLATASCTAQVSPADFRRLLAEAGRAAGRRVIIVHEAGQPIDHPVAAHFPEGRYLKFIVARILPLT